MTANTNYRQIANRPGRKPGTWCFRHRTVRTALQAMVFFLCSHLALAANPTISSVTFAGGSQNLAVKIVGTGFGAAPTGVPCRKCSTPYLNITDGRGYGCELFDITSWSDSEIVFSGFQGNTGDSVLVSVLNKATGLAGITAVTIPKTVTPTAPIIKSVSFAGAIGRNLEITVAGSGFGASPPGLPFGGDMPFFSLNVNPFAKQEWEAGYTGDSVYLKYGLWSPKRILIIGLGGTYGTGSFVLHPNEPLAIAVANSGTCGLNMNVMDKSIGPTSIAGLWAGYLR